ncbi:MAG: radical SAM protein [Gemmatimonadota bacterium]|nr:radical SAM protein [Gemmatimonadota bacterium]
MDVPFVARDLSWIDEFIERVRPYVFVREIDQLIIKRPNQAQKLNAQGVTILKRLLDGASVHELLNDIGRDPRIVRDVELFMYEVKRFMEGTLDEATRTHAVDVQPFDLGFSQLPVLSEIALTYRCNLKCSFCYAGCNCTTNPVGDDREMTTAEVQSVLQKISEEGQVPSVSFTGGEATVRRDLCELVQSAHALGLRVNLITNGTLITEARATALAAAGLDSAQVSLEGVSATTHEKITQIPHSFMRAVAGVRHLKAAGIHVHTNTTINRDNLHECVRMPEFVKRELGNTKFSMNLVIPTGSAALDERLVVRYRELAPYLMAIQAESRRHGVEFMWYSPTPMCMFNPVARGLGNKGCAACDGLLSVAANGDVLPCASYDETVGNLLEQSVQDVWESPRAKLFRDKFLAHPECRSCQDFAICNGACPLYWRQMGFDELTGCRGFAPLEPGHFTQ